MNYELNELNKFRFLNKAAKAADFANSCSSATKLQNYIGSNSYYSLNS